MDRLQAYIAVGGDLKNVVYRDDLTWPELVLIKHIHGEASVTGVEVLGESSYEPIHEPGRLQSRYGRRYFEVWHRYQSDLPFTAPASIPRFDDEVVVETRRRRDPAAFAAAAERQTRNDQGATRMATQPRPGDNPHPDPNQPRPDPNPKPDQPKPGDQRRAKAA